MSEIDGRKRELRREFKRARRVLGTGERTRIDAEVAARVTALPAWQTADVTLAYLSVGDEVDSRGLVWRAWREGMVVAAPRVVGVRQMVWHRIEDFDHLLTSDLHVEEPPDDAATILDPAVEVAAGRRLIALVPGLAFDVHGYRLGYGGGFYDAFLASFSGVSVGLVREAQLVESLLDLGGVEAHDTCVDMLVSETRCIVCAS